MTAILPPMHATYENNLYNVYGEVSGRLRGQGLGLLRDVIIADRDAAAVAPWQNPGVVADPGAYGAIPWIDVPRKYAVMILLEATSTDGGELLQKAKPTLDAILGPIAGDAGSTVASPLWEAGMMATAPDAGAPDVAASDSGTSSVGDASAE